MTEEKEKTGGGVRDGQRPERALKKGSETEKMKKIDEREDEGNGGS